MLIEAKCQKIVYYTQEKWNTGVQQCNYYIHNKNGLAECYLLLRTLLLFKAVLTVGKDIA